jgi:hypothetical protein
MVAALTSGGAACGTQDLPSKRGPTKQQHICLSAIATLTRTQYTDHLAYNT